MTRVNDGAISDGTFLRTYAGADIIRSTAFVRFRCFRSFSIPLADIDVFIQVLFWVKLGHGVPVANSSSVNCLFVLKADSTNKQTKMRLKNSKLTTFYFHFFLFFSDNFVKQDRSLMFLRCVIEVLEQTPFHLTIISF